jgi:hypothetical protein
LSSQATWLAGQYDNPVPTWFLAPIAGLKLPTQVEELLRGVMDGWRAATIAEWAWEVYRIMPDTWFILIYWPVAGSVSVQNNDCSGFCRAKTYGFGSESRTLLWGKNNFFVAYQ